MSFRKLAGGGAACAYCGFVLVMEGERQCCPAGRDYDALRAERDSLQKRVTECESVMLHYGMETEHSCMCQFYDDTDELAGECAYHEKIRSERDEAVRKYEERVRQHEEYIAFADEEITGLIEKKRMVLVSLDEAAALLREIVAWRVAIECVAPELGGVATTLSRIDDFLAKLEERK